MDHDDEDCQDGGEGILFLGPLPADLQNITVYSGGIHISAREPDAAKALMTFLTTPAAGTSIKKHGLEPG